jgi:hypothetical protein
MAALDPPLTRELSALYSNQRDEPTCAYHVFCKIILKNRIESFYPLPINLEIYNTNKCNRYLNTTEKQLETLTQEECTPNGFLKIILFHYFYSLYDLYLNGTRTRKEPFSFYDIDSIHPELNHRFIPESISHKKEISDTLGIVNHVTHGLRISYHKIIVYTKVGLLDSIRKIISLGFYVGLHLYDKYSTFEHARHAVTIVAVDEDELIFKNSWGDERVYNMKVDDLKFQLGQYNFRIDSVLFYLPCLTPPPIVTVNSLETMDMFRRWVDDYVRQFPEMMSRVSEMMASMPTTSGPEMASEPPPITRSITPTFEIGDIVTEEGNSTPLTITEKKTKFKYYATYKDEYGDERGTYVFSDQLTKVGGTKRQRKRKSRKRIR